MTEQERKKVIEHIDKIERYARTPGNEWLLAELGKRFSYGSDKIDDIYEYCIEKVLQDQAKRFYEAFPIECIRDGLQEDFVRMESFRRKNAFNDFAMAVYQQIEQITNKVCSIPNLNESVEKLMGHPAYVRKENGEPTISDRPTSTYSIAKLLFIDKACEKSKSNLSALYAVDKIYCVLYFLCYQAKLKSQEFQQFVEYKNIYNAIYQFRNLNHRGSELNNYQKDIIDKIQPQQGIYYFKFMQALLFYVEGVSKGFSEINTLYEYAQKEIRKNVLLEGPITVGYMAIPTDGKNRFKNN